MSASGRKELQMLISRFLIASEASQGLLRTRCRWTRSQTAPLINEYKSDVSNHYFVFSPEGELMVFIFLQVVFRSEVEAIVEGRDPRTRV